MLVSCALIFVLFWLSDFRDLASAAASAHYLFLVPAVAVYFVGLYLRAVRWRFQLALSLSTSPGRLFPVVLLGHAANNVLSVRMGELGLCLQLSRQERLPLVVASGFVVVERLFDALGLLVVGAFAVPFLILTGSFGWDGVPVQLASSLVGVFVGGAVVLLGLLTFASHRPRFRRKLLRAALLAFPRPLALRLSLWTRSFFASLSVLRSPRRQAWLVVALGAASGAAAAYAVSLHLLVLWLSVTTAGAVVLGVMFARSRGFHRAACLRS